MFTVQKGALSTPYIGWYQENNFPYEMPRASNFLILAKDSTWQIKGTINDKDTASETNKQHYAAEVGISCLCWVNSARLFAREGRVGGRVEKSLVKYNWMTQVS